VPTYVALLRGINLGARNRLAMADLRRVLEELGFERVRTHLQSGNAVFKAGIRSAAAVEKAVEQAIMDQLGMDVRVLVRTPAQLRKVLAVNPFGARATDHARYMVVFLEKPLTKKAVADVDPEKYLPEEYAVDGRHLYLWLPDGSHASKLARTLSEQKLGVVGTLRNWRTVTKLAEMAAD
jgi:uncharacterized protein (DUF1697 family)